MVTLVSITHNFSLSMKYALIYSTFSYILFLKQQQFNVFYLFVENITMFNSKYSNFVKPTDECVSARYLQNNLSGEEAKRLYLEEIREVKEATPATNDNVSTRINKNKRKRKIREIKLSDKDLFLTVENNDIETLKLVLDHYPDKINLLDDYGWSLLMIACQANNVETVKELLHRGADISIRDRAGNSAHSLIIKSKNLVIADLLLSHRHKTVKLENRTEHKKVKRKEEFQCVICNDRTFSDKQEHLSSTIHNINASKSVKIPPNYLIPATNKGYQIMVKVGWDKQSGLGPDGAGQKYPIKTVQKRDKKGLGLDKRKRDEEIKDPIKNLNKKILANDYQYSRRMEMNFRREFY